MKAPRRFRADIKGNVAVIFSLSAIPIIFALGMSLDYGAATKRRAHLNAVADAAVLAAVSPSLMSQLPAVAQASAISFFNSQVQSMAGIDPKKISLTVTVTDSTNGSNAKVRTATAKYNVPSANAFGTVLHMSTIMIGGTSTSSATVAPNIDYYLMIDSSPSMAIPATPAGITWMTQHTGDQCAFACHQYAPASGNPGNIDDYQVARNGNIQLRIDLVAQATSQLMTTAQSIESQNNNTYRMAGYTFDVATNNVFPLTADLTSNSPNSAASKAAGIQVYEVYSENTNCTKFSANGKTCTQTTGNNDMDTDFDTAFNTLNAAMPNPGNGTSQPGDTPQEVLFIVTDAISDESYNGQRIYTPFGGGTSNSGMTQTQCAAIKQRGIRIAVLYLTYNPLPAGTWYWTQGINNQQAIAPTAGTTCASPGLFFQVDTGGDITSAMNTLFQKTLKTAHLTN